MNVYIYDIPDGINYTRLVIILPKRSIERTRITDNVGRFWNTCARRALAFKRIQYGVYVMDRD